MNDNEYQIGNNPNITQTTTHVEKKNVEATDQVAVQPNAASFAEALSQPIAENVTPQVEVKTVPTAEKIVLNDTVNEENVAAVQNVITAGEVKILRGVDKAILEKLLAVQKKRVANNRKVTLDFTLYHSGYKGAIKALSQGHLNKFKATVGDAYERTNALYRMIHDHIVSTSIFEDGSVPDYITWLKITSYVDVDSLIHALFTRTYPNPFKYPITCSNLVDKENNDGIMERDVCEHTNKVMLTPTSLTIVRDDKVASKMIEIIHDSSNTAELLKKSRLNVTKRIAASDGMFIDIQAPSLHKFLKHLKEFKAKDIEDYEQLVNCSLFTGAVLYPVEHPQTKEINHVPDTSISGIFNDYYYNLATPDDMDNIEKAMVTFTDKHAVVHKTPPVKCEACEQVIDAQQISVDYLFFRAIGTV